VVLLLLLREVLVPTGILLLLVLLLLLILHCGVWLLLMQDVLLYFLQAITELYNAFLELRFEFQ
jgi:hypothetical protein